MRLVNAQTKAAIVEFQGTKTIFYNKFLEQEMRTLGIPIPHGLRGVFHGKQEVHLEDTEFQKAFKEVYYVTHIDPTRFKWEQDPKKC